MKNSTKSFITVFRKRVNMILDRYNIRLNQMFKQNKYHFIASKRMHFENKRLFKTLSKHVLCYSFVETKHLPQQNLELFVSTWYVHIVYQTTGINEK